MRGKKKLAPRLPAGRGRGSPEGWLGAAYECLVDGGVDAVRVMPLAKRLRLSRTSFYWFYQDRDALLAALIGRWRAKNTGNLIKQSELYAESLCEAILNVFDCWLNAELFDSRLEFAVRSWAQQSAAVAREIKTADAARLEALQTMLIRHGCEPHAADVRARTIYLTQIGYISMKTKEDSVSRMNRIGEYVAIFAGRRPQQRDLDRFFARNDYRPRGAAAPKRPAGARRRQSNSQPLTSPRPPTA
jgi:AcrR family transcriptional regulator